MTEAEFDEFVSPLLLKAAEETKRLGGKLVAFSEYRTISKNEDVEPVETEGYCTTRMWPDGQPGFALVVDMLSRSANNFDRFLFGLAKAHREGTLDVSQSMLASWLDLPPFVPAPPAAEPPGNPPVRPV